ncbi:MAG: MBL fold metallo-hydrolase [Cryomorphaceae bacterium]|nr:MBL fold metallo-hydrolase [Cryomorphaceae bacterium]
MKVEQIYTGCLAQGAYYIVSNREAAIIDPLRETQPYIDRLERDGVKLKYIFETHFHADFVSGHVDLSKATGADIVFGPTAKTEFDAIIAKDNQIFRVGDVTFVALHTPGHTMESTTYLLRDESGNDHAIFTGDTLFLGDVGRPDLAQKAASMTQEELAGLLYDSLTQKIMPLADEVTVYPGHGAGSACGKNMMKETVDTLGNQKAVNYALKQPNKTAFVAAVTDGLLPPPAYFGDNVAMNKKGYQSFEEVRKSAMQALSPAAFEAAAEETGALILDTRDNGVFYKGFVPNAINIGLNGDFAPWVGAMIGSVNQPILLVTEDGQEEEAVTRLSRVGFDNVLGYLAGGVNRWVADNRELDTVNRITADQFANSVKIGEHIVFDVRKESEYVAEHVEEAYSRPLDFINEWFTDLGQHDHVFIHCAGGYRSMIAASILQSRGIRNFTEIEGGFKAIAEAGVAKTDFVCPSKIAAK